MTRRVLSTLKDNLRVTRLGRSYIEQIAYTSLDPDKAAKIANAFADAYIEDRCRRSLKQPIAQASGWSSESESCASRRAMPTRKFRTSNPKTASSSVSMASWRARSSLISLE